MAYPGIDRVDGVAVVTLERGKVNALNEPFVDELTGIFEDLKGDDGVKAVVLAGRGPFFSFGFDIPEFLGYAKNDFLRFLRKFTQLYAKMFVFTKPLLAALNGHTVAGGCMLALTGDERFMVPGKAKISLNEIRFGSTVFAGSVEMLRFCAGRKNAQTILFSGDMFTAEEAARLDLIDRVVPEERLLDESLKRAAELGEQPVAAFRNIKKLLRQPVADEMAKREEQSLREFVEIWYSDDTRTFLRGITIRE
ncbi:MAG: enoyl-CoA hydratase/isomerase family protein [Candidatus Aminicenantes bacterium]|nr:enoyl-CoA hydratase/isomerase family protein [Candidatus Aminicenantes bacterium]